MKESSNKKPLSELDHELYLSPDHPRGDVLRRLLEAGATHARAFAGRMRKRAATSAVGCQSDSADASKLARLEPLQV